MFLLCQSPATGANHEQMKSGRRWRVRSSTFWDVFTNMPLSNPAVWDQASFFFPLLFPQGNKLVTNLCDSLSNAGAS